MANLIFCATDRAMERWTREIFQEKGDYPFPLKQRADIAKAIEALKDGRDVVANALSAATGWRAPEGTTAVIDEELRDPSRAGLAAQCKARAPGIHLYPHQLRTINALGKISEGLDEQQFLDRVFRRGRTPVLPQIIDVSHLKAEAIIQSMNRKRGEAVKAGSFENIVPAHDLDEGLSMANARQTQGRLVIAMDRFDAAMAAEGHPGAVRIDSPEKMGEARAALKHGGTVVADACMLHPGAGRHIQPEIEMTKAAAGCPAAARAAIRLCREILIKRDPAAEAAGPDLE